MKTPRCRKLIQHALAFFDHCRIWPHIIPYISISTLYKLKKHCSVCRCVVNSRHSCLTPYVHNYSSPPKLLCLGILQVNTSQLPCPHSGSPNLRIKPRYPTQAVFLHPDPLWKPQRILHGGVGSFTSSSRDLSWPRNLLHW